MIDSVLMHMIARLNNSILFFVIFEERIGERPLIKETKICVFHYVTRYFSSVSFSK